MAPRIFSSDVHPRSSRASADTVETALPSRHTRPELNIKSPADEAYGMPARRSLFPTLTPVIQAITLFDGYIDDGGHTSAQPGS